MKCHTRVYRKKIFGFLTDSSINIRVGARRLQWEETQQCGGLY